MCKPENLARAAIASPSSARNEAIGCEAVSSTALGIICWCQQARERSTRVSSSRTDWAVTKGWWLEVSATTISTSPYPHWRISLRPITYSCTQKRQTAQQATSPSPCAIPQSMSPRPAATTMAAGFPHSPMGGDAAAAEEVQGAEGQGVEEEQGVRQVGERPRDGVVVGLCAAEQCASSP